MGWTTDMNGLPIYIDDETGQITTPVSQPQPTPKPTQPTQPAQTTPAPSPTPPWEGSKGATDAGIPKFGTPEYAQAAQQIAVKNLDPFKQGDNYGCIGCLPSTSENQRNRAVATGGW